MENDNLVHIVLLIEITTGALLPALAFIPMSAWL